MGMSDTVELDMPSEEEFLDLELVEQAGPGAGFYILSNQLDFVGVAYGQGFRGLHLESRQDYGSIFGNNTPVRALRLGYDVHRQNQIDGVKPIHALDGLVIPEDTPPAEFTRTLLPQVTTAARALLANPDIPRRLDQADLIQRIELYESIQAGLSEGRLTIDPSSGSIDLNNLELLET